HGKNNFISYIQVITVEQNAECLGGHLRRIWGSNIVHVPYFVTNHPLHNNIARKSCKLSLKMVQETQLLGNNRGHVPSCFYACPDRKSNPPQSGGGWYHRLA